MTNIKLSKSEENYLKSIFNLSEFGNKKVSTNSISKILNIEPASVTDMIKKLSKKKLIYHERYKGSSISKSGIKHFWGPCGRSLIFSISGCIQDPNMYISDESYGNFEEIVRSRFLIFGL